MAEKYVIDGAKIECPLCSNPKGELKVTSNTISIQGKPWATEADKANTNLIFQGTCRKFPIPPPCIGVISPDKWQNTGAGMKIDGNAPLLESSQILCNTGGVPITITDTTQKSVPTNLRALKNTGAPIPKAVEDKEPLIVHAYWINKNLNRTTLFAHGDKVRIFLETENAHGKKVTVKIHEYDFGLANDDFIHEYSWNIEDTKLIYSFDLIPKLFVKGEEDMLHLYFSIQIEGQDKEEFCNNDSEYLKVHLVSYVPGVMRALGWNKGAAMQDEWFGRPGSETPKTNTPETTIINMDWVLGFERAKKVYDKMIEERIWVNTAGKPALIKEINLMITDGKVKTPTRKDQAEPFGVFDDTIITYKGEKRPLFDKYHYQEREFEEKGITATDEDLDDMFAALANFVFRMAAGGAIIRKDDHYLIEINKVVIYVRDSFDFIDSGWNRLKSQPLGYWNIEENKVSTDEGEGFRYINNDSYKKYRKEFNKGGDFLVYSDLKTIVVEGEFEVPLNSFVFHV